MKALELELNSAESALPKGGGEGGREEGMLGSYHPAQVKAVSQNLQVRREGGRKEGRKEEREGGREGVR